MLPETDDAAVQADAYIDSLLTGHGRALVPRAASGREPGHGYLDDQPRVREAIALLENGLPRFHPSFLFEEWLAEQLRRAVTNPGPRSAGEIVPFVVLEDRRPVDRRLILGGAIASGVSIAGAAVIAWRRSRD